MKKLLLVLMVVSMAALLFTGCFNVPVAVTGVTLDQATMTLIAEGATGTLVATVAPADATDQSVTWSSSTPAVATVANGVVTPLTAGTTTITVTTVDGSLTETCAVTVTSSVVPTDITIAVAAEWLNTATGKTYVKGGSKEITVTFPTAVENPLVKVGTAVVPVFTVDDKVYKGTHKFVGDDAVLITVGGVCDEDLCAAKSVVVDSGKPYAELKATVAECECYTGFALTVTSDWTETQDCPPDDEGCCGDDSSGLATWNVKIYDEMPWEDCCVGDPCVDPIKVADGTACPVTITTECIDEVYTQDYGWVDFFSNHYWVIATLTDKVGNTISYYGEVYPDAATEGVDKFVELFYDPTSIDCLCPAEDPALADAIIGDCDGTPATECWVEPLNPCPEVTLSDNTPIVGQEVTITIDYADAKPAVGTVSAYVGPSIKTLPLGIPEEAQELVLTQTSVDPDPKVYTAPYTFQQAGTDYIYVVDGCGDCTPCKTGITVLPAVCPDIAIEDEVEYLEDMWIDGGWHEVTITYAVPTEGVRLFYSPEPVLFTSPVIPAITVEIELETDDNMTFTGNVFFTGLIPIFEVCDTEWLYVLSGESCCPVVCSRTVKVDYEAPCVELAVAVVDCSDCDTACEVWISSDTCAYSADPCCVSTTDCCDDCTTFDWTLTVYDAQPFEEDECGDCIPDICAEVVKTCTGTGCSVDCNVFGCLTEDEWAELETEYYVVFEAVDIVGNEFTSYGVLTVDTRDCSATELWGSDEPDDNVDCELLTEHAIMGNCSCP